jgi:predicted transcriptional regulator
MEYAQFDNDLTPRAIHKKIIAILEQNPSTREEIYEPIKASRTKVDQQIRKLISNDVIDKKFYDGEWYYGLTMLYRNEIDSLKLKGD